MIIGNIRLPGDKSISHRAALFSALREGKSVFTNFNLNDDCKATLSCLMDLGIRHQINKNQLTIFGKEIENWQKPLRSLNAQNSGTTARLLSGILVALKFETKLIGDFSLSKRPMNRVVEPLQKMGAIIDSNKGYLPLNFKSSRSLKSITYNTPVASAQVKSAVLLAGLFAKGPTKVIENSITRDHTERMLSLDSKISEGKKEIICSNKNLIPDLSMDIPGDFSSAAFFICAALAIPNSELKITDVSLNPTRTGLIKVLRNMGANLRSEIKKEKPEPTGIIEAGYSKLQNIEIPAEIVPNIIDEIPVLAVLATQAEGQFTIRNAEELRFKESDRIDLMIKNFKNIGIEAEEYQDGFSLKGPQKFSGGQITTKGDHRIAMAFSIANLFTAGKIEIDDPDCASVSFPDFYHTLANIQK